MPRKIAAKKVTIVTGDGFADDSPRKRTQRARTLVAAAVAVAPRGMQADDDTEDAIATWKHTHQAKARAEFDNDLARSRVSLLFTKHRVQYFLSTLGTVPLQMRGGTPKTDWEALARAAISPKKLDGLIATYTKTSDVTPTVSAPAGWAAELGLKAAG